MVGLVGHEGSRTFPSIPIVSVDRAAWYRLTDIDFDYSAISAYYEDLPYSGKPRLEDCRIHISSLICVLSRQKGVPISWPASPKQSVGDSARPAVPYERPVYRKYLINLDGLHLPEAEDAALFDPLAPSADILVFLGNSIHTNDLSRPTSVLESQLASYARGKEAWPLMSEDEARLREDLKHQILEVRREPGRVVDAAEGAIEEGGPAVLSSFDDPLLIPISMGVGAVQHLLMSSSKRRALRKVRNRLMTCICQRAAAINAGQVPTSLGMHAVTGQFRKDAHLNPVLIRSPYGRKLFFRSVDRGVDKESAARSFHKLPLLKA